MATPPLPVTVQSSSDSVPQLAIAPPVMGPGRGFAKTTPPVSVSPSRRTLDPPWIHRMVPRSCPSMVSMLAPGPTIARSPSISGNGPWVSVRVPWRPGANVIATPPIGS